MDWLANISEDAVVLVPTRGLQHSLSKRYAELQVSAGRTAWQTPQIIVWEDYLEQLWRANKHTFDKAYIRLNTAQAYLVWQQVIMRAKKDDAELLLLNEQQTASVTQRSWKLAHKWRISFESIQLREDLDSTAFVSWCQAYQKRLDEKGWIDPPQLEHLLIEKTDSLLGLPEKLVFAYFDLMSSGQRAHIQQCEKRGIAVSHVAMTNSAMTEASENKDQKISYQAYQQEDEELLTVMRRARQLIEQDKNIRVGIVIPALSENRARIEQHARSVFYPALSPLQCQQRDLVYRFSLGQPLIKIPYIHSMLNALELLKNSFSYQNLYAFLTSEWWPLCQQHSNGTADLIRLDRAIKNRRSPWLNWHDVQSICQEKLPEADYLNQFIQSLIEFKTNTLSQGDNLKGNHLQGNHLQESHLQDGHSQERVSQSNLHSARHWQTIFSDWLLLLDWSENELDSWHYQAHESWLETMQTFVSHDLVQSNIGLNRALQTLSSLCKEKVYMRQAKDEPILISGVLEGIGQTVDYLFVTGMHEAYPAPMNQDPFIANAALAEQGYPFADKSAEFIYEQNKLASLLAGGHNIEVSYASQHQEGEYASTTLLREHEFVAVELDNANKAQSQLVEYTDTIGLECLQSANIQGGSKVFENQSHCPFKAYVEHRLLRQSEEDPEFGLDARDAGTLVHDLLENIWRELQSFSSLSRLGETDLSALIERHVDAYIDTPNPKFQFDRKRLLSLEKPRIKKLLMEWFVLEQEQRVLPYTVIGIEKKMHSEFGGIPIKLIIDRIDRTDQGDCLIIDYKTGYAEISDWNGERPKSPQMPLYALALDQHSDYKIKGIGFGKLKSNDCALNGVSALENVGANFKEHISSRDKKPWSEQMQEWHDNLTDLATEFLEGQAVVSPSKAKPCQYCDLHSMCRVHQLNSQSGKASDQKAEYTTGYSAGEQS